MEYLNIDLMKYTADNHRFNVVLRASINMNRIDFSLSLLENNQIVNEMDLIEGLVNFVAMPFTFVDDISSLILYEPNMGELKINLDFGKPKYIEEMEKILLDDNLSFGIFLTFPRVNIMLDYIMENADNISADDLLTFIKSNYESLTTKDLFIELILIPKNRKKAKGVVDSLQGKIVKRVPFSVFMDSLFVSANEKVDPRENILKSIKTYGLKTDITLSMN